MLHACSSSEKIQYIDLINNRYSVQNKLTKGLITGKISYTDSAATDSFMENLLKQHPQFFDSILKYRENWNVQIIYTEINRDRNNTPKFTDHYFNVDASKYFYPASTVKLPTALLALQRLNELSKTGITKSTSMITETAYSGQSATYNDPQTINGRPNIESYIKRIFLVSDNEAFNRLYEFLGSQYINEQLHSKGYTSAQIIHRLNIYLSEDENRHTNPVKFLNANDTILYEQPLAYNETKYPERSDSLGDGYYDAGKLIDTPMNFSKKNKLNLEDLHHILRSVIFPDNVPLKERFNLTKSDYDFVRKYMSQYPSESTYPAYDSVQYYDAYGKFLLYGADTNSLPKNIRIFNKIGDAYGQMIDVAYVADFSKNIEFFLSAAIYCNTDGIINDDKYDYNTIGYPFMKNLGQVIYNYEAKRKRTYQPDLSSFKIVYDK